MAIVSESIGYDPAEVLSDTIQAAEADIARGHFVYLNTSGKALRAINTSAAAAAAIGIVTSIAGDGAPNKSATAIDDSVTVVFAGPVRGFTGLTPAAVQYVAGTAGTITPTASTASGRHNQKVGRALSATELLVGLAGTQTPVAV